MGGSCYFQPPVSFPSIETRSREDTCAKYLSTAGVARNHLFTAPAHLLPIERGKLCVAVIVLLRGVGSALPVINSPRSLSNHTCLISGVDSFYAGPNCHQSSALRVNGSHASGTLPQAFAKLLPPGKPPQPIRLPEGRASLTIVIVPTGS
jgi:hypothetical protein